MDVLRVGLAQRATNRIGMFTGSSDDRRSDGENAQLCEPPTMVE